MTKNEKQSKRYLYVNLSFMDIVFYTLKCVHQVFNVILVIHQHSGTLFAMSSMRVSM
jgi:hypothetical protein